MTMNNLPNAGVLWPNSSLLGNRRGGQGELADISSPVNGTLIQRVSLLSQQEIASLAASILPPSPIEPEQLWGFTVRLYQALDAMRPLLVEALRLETGFVSEDAEELIAGSLAYVDRFCNLPSEVTEPGALAQTYRQKEQTRQIHLTRAAWGTVVVILPQNAFLLLAVTTLLNALAAGNRVVLRAPLQSARSAALLAAAVEAAEPPHNAVSIVMTRAKELLAAFYSSPDACLIHFMGSSRHAPEIIADGFRHGKATVVDGEGNGWVWVGEDACPTTAARLLTAGAVRYNGQTCTSINGAMIHPDLYGQVRKLLTDHWKRLRCGDPLSEDVEVGPLFDVAQAEWCERQIKESGGAVLCGGRRQSNLLFPTLVENPLSTCGLVTEGLFGPALWISPAAADTFVDRWRQNRYPLCAGILSPSADPHLWSGRLQNLARLVVNGDISEEYLFEPWGGYPASGMNPVGSWKDKYQRVLQIDAPTR